MFSRHSFSFCKQIKSQQPKKILKLNNTFQTIISPQEFNKSVKKFTMTPPEFESIHQDPFLKQFKVFSSRYYNDTTRYPDDHELVIDLKTFDLKVYLKYLFQTKWEDLEPKDEFLYRVLQVYLFFIIHLIIRETLFHYYGLKQDSQLGVTKQKLSVASRDTHYDYTRFEQEFDYNMLLFTRSIKRIKNELDID